MLKLRREEKTIMISTTIESARNLLPMGEGFQRPRNKVI